MFEKLKHILHLPSFNQANSENITEFSEAIDWIQAYKKAENFDTAIFACRELILKTKSSINYYEEVLKKLTFSEASNIEKISKVASEKKRSLSPILVMLYKRLDVLDKTMMDIEKNKQKNEKIKLDTLQKERFTISTREIDACIKKKEYTHALSFAKKLVADFPNEKKAIKVLTKIQKLHSSQKTKEQTEEEKREKITKIFNEVGVEMDTLKAKGGYSFLERLQLVMKEMRMKGLEKKEYVNRQRALKSIESLLVKSGTMDNIGEENKNEELFSIMNSGLSKDLDDFSLHGFDFYGKILGKDKIVGDTF